MYFFDKILVNSKKITTLQNIIRNVFVGIKTQEVEKFRK